MASVYEVVTGKVLDELKKGIVPWRQPWIVRKYNLFSNRPYRGINLLLLNKGGGFATWRQIHERGLKVKKGAKAFMVVFHKPFWINTETGEVYAENELDYLTGEELSLLEKKFMLRYYSVFHEDDIEGLDDESRKKDWETTDPGEFVSSIEDKPNIFLDGDSSYYLPSKDEIHLPKPEFFESKDAFFQTLFHELVHSTGHTSRLNRPLKSLNDDPKSYAFEELIADMGSAMICSMTGVDPDWQNTASYVGSWIKKLESDKTFIVRAANQAQKAVDWLSSKARMGEKLNELKEKMVVNM